MSDDKEFDVFLSHSSMDKTFVERLTDGLGAGGVRVWLDQIEMGLGDSLFDHIAAGIEKARFFAIVLSQNSLQSKWVRAELKAALNRELEEGRTFVIPIVIEDIDVPTFLGDKIYADFRTEENFDTVLKALVNKTVLVKLLEGRAQGYSDGNVTYYPDRFLPDLRFFVGRKEVLTAIRETLDRDHRAVLHNISGIGKTFTSYQYAHENGKGYDKIFLVRATKEEWLESLAKNGEAVDPALANVTEQEVKARGFKDWLESNGNWLVIYDNVDMPKLLFPFIPATTKGDCLFTSNFEESVLLGTEVGIEKMKVDDAGKLLYNRSVGKLDAVPDLDGKEKEAFENLLKEIDGLPVTLTSFGAVIFEKKWSFERALIEYNKTPEIAWESEAFYSPYQHRSAGRIFSLLYQELTKDRKIGKAVKIILDSICFISPDEIPEELLKEILKDEYPTFVKSEDPDVYWDSVREKLTAYDLLKYDKQKETFTTHRAIQRVTQNKLKGKERETCVSLAGILNGLFPSYDYTNREECEKYYQHVLMLVENADRFGAEAEDTNELYFRLGKYLHGLGNYVLAERFLLRAAEISAAVLGDESSTHARDLNDLAGMYWLQGRYDEAIEKFEEALRIDEKTIGREHPGYAIDLNNLANVYYEQGRYDEAIEKYEEAMQITGKTVGKEHPAYAIRLNNLASVYQARGELERAEKLYERARKIREKVLGKLHPDTAITYWWIGVLRYKQARYSEALPMFEEAYRQFVHFFGEEHPNTKNLKSHLETCQKKVKSS